MSYILKALKQAQESRSIDGTPLTAASQRLRNGERPRQIPWRWIAAAALVLNGLVLLLLVVLPRFGSQAPTSGTPPVTTAAPAVPTAPEAPPAAVLPPRPVAPAPRAIVQPPPPAHAPAVVTQAPVMPTPPPARSIPAPVPRPKPVEPIRPPGLASRPPERAVSEPTERPGGERTASVTPQSAPPPVVAVVTPPPPAPDVGPELREAVEKFKLEVLVWAADPRDRMVFLSGRKFVEGQSLDGKVVVERIAEDSIVLAYQGQRVRVKRP